MNYNPNWANIWFEVHPPPGLQPLGPWLEEPSATNLVYMEVVGLPQNHRGEWMSQKRS